MKLWITVGVSGSGKTTWANNFQFHNSNLVIICRDDYRRKILAQKKEQLVSRFRWKDWNWKWEKEVDILRDIDLEKAIKHGNEIALADTNLHPASRNSDIIRRCEAAGYKIEYKYFPLTWDEAIERNAHRLWGVSYSVLQKQFEQWNNMFPTFAPFPNRGYVPAIIVDIDGTVAEMDGRHPYDWFKVGTDKPRPHVINIVKALSLTHHVIFASGRDGCCWEQTKEWLDREVSLADYDLLMRAPKDQRKDDIVKREILDQIDPKYKIEMVIDDRPQVCRMWRSIGLNVVQVADPYKEF
jgi:predicted kinase